MQAHQRPLASSLLTLTPLSDGEGAPEPEVARGRADGDAEDPRLHHPSQVAVEHAQRFRTDTERDLLLLAGSEPHTLETGELQNGARHARQLVLHVQLHDLVAGAGPDVL